MTNVDIAMNLFIRSNHESESLRMECLNRLRAATLAFSKCEAAEYKKRSRAYVGWVVSQRRSDVSGELNWRERLVAA